MHRLKYALSAGVVALVPLAASAAAITEDFTLAVPSTTVSFGNSFNSSPVDKFNQTNGPLSELMVTLSGSGTLAINSGGGLSAFLGSTLISEFPGASQDFTSSGPIEFNITSIDSAASDLGDFSGSGTTSLVLSFVPLGGSSTVAAPELKGTITYEFTPSAVPEPGSIALLGAALVGFALVRRRGRLVAAPQNR